MFFPLFAPFFVASAFDPDAAAFFIRASITDVTQKAAVNQLVLDLKAASLWTKIYALWPIVGGNATAHSKNLIADLYNITWVGTPTQSANGVTFNGTTQYGDTNFLCNIATYSNSSLGVYLTVQPTGVTGGLLVAQATTEELLLQANPSGGVFTFDAGAFSGRGSAVAVASYLGLLSASRGGQTDKRLYQNGSLLSTQAQSGNTPNPALNLFLAAYNFNGAPALLSPNRTSLAFVAQNFSTANHAAFYTAVQTYQTTLGRQV